MDAVDLVKLIVSREQGEEREHFEEHTSHSPNVHFVVVVAICEQTLRRSVPSCRYVFCEGGLGINASAGSKIGQFYLVVFDKNVFPKRSGMIVTVLYLCGIFRFCAYGRWT